MPGGRGRGHDSKKLPVVGKSNEKEKTQNMPPPPNPGNSHDNEQSENDMDYLSTDDDSFSSQWQTQARKNRKRKTSGNMSPPPSETRPKTQKIENEIIVEIESNQINISKANPIKIARSINEIAGPVKEIKPKYQKLQVTITRQQAHIFYKTKQIGGYQVKITPKKENKPIFKGISHQIDTEIETEEIKQEINKTNTSIEKVERMTRYNRNTGEREPIPTIILYFSKPLPDTIKIAYSQHKVKTYIPKPVRCYKCQKFGHISEKCNAKQKCPKCAQEHTYEQCNQTNTKCTNCGGNHSAGYKGCEKYLDAKHITEMSAINRISYAQAAKIVNNENKNQQTKEQQKTQQKTKSEKSKQTVTKSNDQSETEEETEYQYHTIRETMQDTEIQMTEKLIATIIKLISIAKDPKFWEYERKARITIMTAFVNTINETALKSQEILKHYINADNTPDFFKP